MFVDNNPQRYFWKAVLEDGTVFPEQVSDYRSLDFEKILTFEIYGEFGFNAQSGIIWFRDPLTDAIDTYTVAVVGHPFDRKSDRIFQFKDSIADLSGAGGVIKKHTIGYTYDFGAIKFSLSLVLDIDSQKRWMEVLVENTAPEMVSISVTKNGALFFTNSAELEGQNIMVVEV